MSIAQMFFMAAVGIPGGLMLLLAVAGTLFAAGLDTPDKKERARYGWTAMIFYFAGCVLVGIAAAIWEAAP